MRLLQVATGTGELVDLHPNVTVVAGLDEDARRRLTDTVTGLPNGRVAGVSGLVEAHGVLFDLVPELLAVLDLASPDLRPVVTAGDLPDRGLDPRVAQRSIARSAVEAIEERLSDLARDEAAADHARAALERARRAAERADADAAGQIEAVDDLRRELDQAVERCRSLEERHSDLAAELAAASAAWAEVEAATEDVRSRRQAAATRCAALAVVLDQARATRDPGAELDAQEATAALAAVEAEVEAVLAMAAATDPSEPGVPGAERLAQVQDEIADLEQRAAAITPSGVQQVLDALQAIRTVEHGPLVPVQEAVALADQIAELDEDLVATSGVVGPSSDVAAGRERLEAARHALLVAEQTLSRSLDAAQVDRLEKAHADLLDAIDRGDRRFGGAKARTQVELRRAEEQVVLDELGFTSYSDYMMGHSQVRMDSEHEAQRRAARTEMEDAEAAWQVLEAETEAELARAERMERRRQLADQGRELVGRPVPTEAILDELRALRQREQVGSALVEALQEALDEAGVPVGDGDLGRDDLARLAELLLQEAEAAAPREREVRDRLDALSAERVELVAALELEQAAGSASDEAAGGDGEQRQAEARERARSAAQRLAAHRVAEGAVTALTQELAGAAEEERVAAEAASEAVAAVSDAAARAADLQAELARLDVELAEARRVASEATDALQARRDGEHAPSADDLRAAADDAEGVLGAAEQHAADLAEQRASLERERAEAAHALQALEDVTAEASEADPPAETALSEEIEWYLLARLAAQRSVSIAGSVPLLLDDALAGLDQDDLVHVLGRLERMADAVQVIVISDDPLVASWADVTGADRAAVVRPEPASAPEGDGIASGYRR